MDLYKPVACLRASGSQCNSSELLYVTVNLLNEHLVPIWQLGGAELKAQK